jgi:hypothetical protein
MNLIERTRFGVFPALRIGRFWIVRFPNGRKKLGWVSANVCAICKQPLTLKRGLLCNNCNMVIGFLKCQ